MGASESKNPDQEVEERVHEPYLIQWDQYGHLRYGEAHKVDPGRQMVEIMELDYVDDIDGKKWYVIETAWLTAWLAYVHHDKHIAPAPGPCRNDRLIIWDPVTNKFVGRPGLVMSHKNCAGDFRRISRETWQKFKEFYPESGPSITMEYFAVMNNGEETNIGRHFTVLDPPPAPVVTISKTHKKKAIALAAKAEEERAAAEAAAAAAKIKAELAKKPPSHVYNNDDEDESKVGDDFSERESSISSSFSTVLNDPRVVSNLPNQPRNPVAEQYAQRARDAAVEDANRASERHSVASQQRTARHGESFTGMPVIPGLPPQMPPPQLAPNAAASTSTAVPPRSNSVASTTSHRGTTVQDMYYVKD